MGLGEWIMQAISPESAGKAARWLYDTRFRLVSLPQRFRLGGVSKAYGSKLLLNFLKERYPGFQLLTCADQEYPVTIFPNRATARPLILDDVGPIELEARWSPQLTFVSRKFYWLMRPITGKDSAPTFVMKSLDQTPSLRMTCGVSDYFTALRTSFALEWELLSACARAEKKDTPRELKSHLPFRDDLESVVSDPVVNGEGRASAVAISVLLVFREGNQLRLWMRRRGVRSLAMSRGKWHVIPAGMFQARYGQYGREFSVMHTLMWEYYEELFGASDPAETNQDPNWFYGDSPVKHLRDMIGAGWAKVYFTGFAINLVSLRPEILLALVIDDESWIDRKDRRHNKEYSLKAELANGKVPLAEKRLPSSPDAIFSDRDLELAPGTITPPGAACLYQGVTFLNQAGVR